MGASSSHGSVLSGGTAAPVMQGGTNHGELPEDTVPYAGPVQEYRVAIVNTKLKAAMSFGFSAGKQVTFSDVQEYYATLQQQYAEYYRMMTFFRIPMAQQSSGFTSAIIPFQGRKLILLVIYKDMYALLKYRKPVMLLFIFLYIIY